MTKEKAIFAGGCFWGVQDYFDKVPGVSKTTAGFSGGYIEEPTHEEVSTDTTGHAESLLVEYDSDTVTYETLVKHFFRMHDPTQYMRQGPDVGSQYRSAIFFLNEGQREVAEKVIEEIKGNYSSDIVTEVSPAEDFYEAEDFHQKYVEKTGKGACHVAYAPIS